MVDVFKPEALKKKDWPHDEPVFSEYLRRARECLLWNMSPEYYDALSEIEYQAWLTAWNELQKETN